MTAVEVDRSALERARAQVLRAVSEDPKLPVLGCVLFESDETTLRLVATDKVRLVLTEVPIGRGDVLRALVTAADLEAVRLAGQVVALSTAGGSLVLASDAGESRLPLAPGEFPDYRRILGEITGDESASTVLVDRDLLRGAIEDLPDDEPLQVRVVAGAIELGELVPVRVPVVHDGPDLVLFVDPRLLHDAVTSAVGSRLALDVTEPLRPIVIRAADDEAFTAVLMPLQVGRRRRR